MYCTAIQKSYLRHGNLSSDEKPWARRLRRERSHTALDTVNAGAFAHWMRRKVTESIFTCTSSVSSDSRQFTRPAACQSAVCGVWKTVCDKRRCELELYTFWRLREKGKERDWMNPCRLVTQTTKAPRWTYVRSTRRAYTDSLRTLLREIAVVVCESGSGVYMYF